MNTDHSYSGLTAQELAILTTHGWRESDFESLPPPWVDPEGGALCSPREAYDKCVARMRETLAAKGE